MNTPLEQKRKLTKDILELLIKLNFGNMECSLEEKILNINKQFWFGGLIIINLMQETNLIVESISKEIKSK